MRRAAAPVDPLLEDVLAHPADDGARLRYAADLTSRGDPRGEFIALQVKGALSSGAERRRASELLKTHRDAWASQLGAARNGQVWERGFLIECKVRASGSAEQWQRARTDPQWRLVRYLRQNMALPDADLADSLEVLLGFNTSAWLGGRRLPWGALRELTARESEIALLVEAHERATHGEPPQFPSVERLRLYDWGRFELAAVAARLSLRSIEIIGPSSYLVPPRDLPSLLAGLERTPLVELAWAPDQADSHRTVFRRGPDGLFTELDVHLDVRKKARPAPSEAQSFLRQRLDELAPRSFRTTLYVSGARVDPGSFDR